MSRIIFLRDEWKICEYRLFRPLVFYSAFGQKEIFEQLYLSTESLSCFARYTGHVHVMTDAEPSVVMGSVFQDLRNHLSTRRFMGLRRSDYAAARYRIVDWPDAYTFQPLLYVDTDVLFDADLRPILIELLFGTMIAAVLEDSTSLATDNSVGADLFRRDHIPVGPTPGVNSGQLGIPRLSDCALLFRIVREVLSGYLAERRRGNLTWIDQPVFNYVAQQLGGVDTATLTKCARVASPQSAHLAPYRAGLVHYWQFPDARAKREGMAAYLAKLRDVAGG
jgi:hypothetical protein